VIKCPPSPPDTFLEWVCHRYLLQLATRGVTCRGSSQLINLIQWAYIAQMCTHILLLSSSVKSLDIKYSNLGCAGRSGMHPDEVDPTRWMELFNSFTSVQRLKFSGKLEPFIAVALRGLTEESAAEVLPALQDLSIEGSTTGRAAQPSIQSFVTARQHSGHPVAVSRSSELPLRRVPSFSNAFMAYRM
jgi:hypothetical protein